MLKTQWIEDNGCCETGQFFVGEDWFGRRKLGIIICDNCMIEESFFNEIRNWLNKQNDDYCITIVGETSLMFYFAVFTNQIILSFYQSPEEIEMLCEKYMEVKRWFKAIEKLLEQ